MSENPLPTVDDPYVRRVFDALSNMDVNLDSDPMIYGPKRMIAKVALCRDHLSRCQQIFLQVSDDLHRLNRAHRKAKLDFDLQMQDLLANDPDVRAGKNVRDREAVATMKLRGDREEMATIESSIQDLDAVMTVVKAKREDLKDIQGRIRDQVKLCQEELGLGGKWGSAPGPGVKTPNLDAAPKVDVEALNLMNALVGGLDGDTSVTDLESFVRKELQERGEEEEEDGVEDPGMVARAKYASDEEPPPKAPVPAPKVEEVVVPAPKVEVAAPAPKEEDEVDPLGGFADAPDEASDTQLPVIEVKPDPTGTSTSVVEIDNFFDGLDLDAADSKTSQTKKLATATPPPLSNEIDLDDLIGSFK